MRYGILDKAKNEIINVLLLDQPPKDPTMGLGNNFQAIQHDTVNLGWKLIGGALVDVSIPPPPTVPQELANWKAHAILTQRGKLDAVNVAIAAMTEPQRTMVTIAFDRADPIPRTSPALNAILKGIGLTDGDIDKMFIDGNALTL